jgi:hypothetical protein
MHLPPQLAHPTESVPTLDFPALAVAHIRVRPSLALFAHAPPPLSPLESALT